MDSSTERPDRYGRPFQTERLHPLGPANGAVTGDLRRFNRGLVLERIFFRGATTRGDVASDTGLTGAAISRITRELADVGLIREREPSKSSGRGRPVTELELAPDGAFVVGIGIGAYEQWVQIANQKGECIARRAIQLLARKPPKRALDLLIKEIRFIVRGAGISWNRLLGITIAIAGVVDQAAGLVIVSPNIGWGRAQIAEPLERALGKPVHVEAMHHTLNLAEARFGATRGLADVVLVNAALGIGASIMEAGQILRGSHAAAGQIGHMRIAGANDLCTCGRRGCLDTIASGYAVLRRMRRIGSRQVPKEHDVCDAQQLIEAIEEERNGDRRASQAFRACGEQLGDALNAVCSIVDPQRIVLAGPLAQTSSYVEGVRSQVLSRRADAPFLYLATQTSDAAAARLALAQFVFSPSLDISRLAG